MRLRRVGILLALCLGAGCVDAVPTAPPGAGPSLAFVPDASGAYTASFPLPYELGDWSYNGTFGSRPQHDELVLPPGTYDLEIEVDGGIIIRDATAGGLPNVDIKNMFIGPGGITVTWPYASPKYLWNVTLNRIGPDSRGIERVTTVWGAPRDGSRTAHGKVRVQGGARFIFSREIGTTGFPWDDYVWRGWLVPEADQRATLIARPVNQGNVTLTCRGDLGQNQVARGKEIACTAAKNPENAPGALTITRWTFNGSPRSDGDPTSPEWKGTMVRGGVVQVQGRIGSGQPQWATVTIVVLDRPLPDAPTMHLEELSDGEEPRVPALPGKVSFTDDLGGFWAYDSPPGDVSPDPIATVSGGPNDGLSYYQDLSFPIWGRIRINTAAMAPGSPLYDAQVRNTTGGGTRVAGMPWCPARVVSRDLPAKSRAHEQAHADAYEAQYAAIVGPALTELERTAGTYIELDDRYNALRGQAHSVADRASWAIHGMRGDPYQPEFFENGRQCNLKNEDGQVLARNPNRQ